MLNLRSFVAKKQDLFRHEISNVKHLHIALCFDRGFIMPAGVALYSIISNNSNINLHFHLLVSGISESECSIFLELEGPNTAISIYHVTDKFDINPDTLVLGIPLSTCLRFLIPEVVDDKITNILYLDCDIICNGSLYELVDYDLKDYIACVISDSPDMQDRVKKLDYGIDFINYFNAGVMLINISAWKKENITQKALEMINNGTVYRYADQDVLNILLNGRLYYIDKKYNNKTTLSVICDQEQKNLSNTIIMHYVTQNKPWYKIFRAKNFEHYFYNSPWKYHKRMLAPSSSDIRLKAKVYWAEGKYSKAISYYYHYLRAKLFGVKI
ncbi:glycosyltransferase family 8 protein [Escherichia coli]|uniref:glycosyltransferase family 8 protein n=1 Tax=Escherichia coli TaxID=562 RepID=UPI003CEBA714